MSMYGRAPSQPPRADPRYLQEIFNNVDKNRSGRINARELQSALSNGTWKPFDANTVQLMMNIFDRDRSGRIDFQEFTSLWNYINDWIKCFESFDKDRSGSIDKRELRDALTSFGYRLSEQTLDFLLTKYDKDRKGSINFDDYVLCCVNLQTLTAAFRSYDTNKKGVITLSYEDFLKLGLSLNP
ncbi:hypothetical protein MRX96_030569 [Rhipicephalus microplus]|uniref:EF-hand domain-containing protein n=1 Tax=Rhipicephalus microplus TaxID=6941 RepID=A0A9J6DNE2_RHIMP|nr:programmed cell death protein 6-like [Rhipicephalus microplus]KAH8023424.1 hypothetical protein HPB51_014539 [Rhipicephalus microplus]